MERRSVVAMESKVRLVSVTPEAEKVMGYCARVSNPRNQDNDNVAGLLRYCLDNGHWSVFEQANMILEIKTSRAISPQILRHRSFSFQEFSQRYAVADGVVVHEARRQDTKNRQNSVDDLDPEVKSWFVKAQEDVWEVAHSRYQEALALGIAKECARALLPLNTATRLYMNGTVRSWIHYIQLRTGHGTQKEHMQIALECREIFSQCFPAIAEALEWPASASCKGRPGGILSIDPSAFQADGPSDDPSNDQSACSN